MSVTIHHLETSPGGCNTVYLRPGLSNLKTTYKSLSHALRDLGVSAADVRKIGERGVPPLLASQASELPPNQCVAVEINGEYLLLAFDGKERALAEHAMRFGDGDTPFTMGSLKSPPPPVPKPESGKSLKEFLSDRWTTQTKPTVIT